AHAAVVHVAADLNAHPADERRTQRERKPELRAVAASQAGLYRGLQVRRERRRALDRSRVPAELEPHKPPEVRKHRDAAVTRRRSELLHHAANSRLVEEAVHETIAEQLLGLAACTPGDLHRQLVTCFTVSSASRR